MGRGKPRGREVLALAPIAVPDGWFVLSQALTASDPWSFMHTDGRLADIHALTGPKGTPFFIQDDWAPSLRELSKDNTCYSCSEESQTDCDMHVPLAALIVEQVSKVTWVRTQRAPALIQLQAKIGDVVVYESMLTSVELGAYDVTYDVIVNPKGWHGSTYMATAPNTAGCGACPYWCLHQELVQEANIQGTLCADLLPLKGEVTRQEEDLLYYDQILQVHAIISKAFSDWKLALDCGTAFEGYPGSFTRDVRLKLVEEDVPRFNCVDHQETCDGAKLANAMLESARLSKIL